jgi:hypothetical protein
MRQPSRYRTPLRYRVPYMWTTPAPYMLALCVVSVAYDYAANPQGFVRYVLALIGYALHG